MTNYAGQCHCGQIHFSCSGEPIFTQYCHCNKCREIASKSTATNDKAGYAFTAAYLTKNFKITHGAEQLEEVIRNNSKLLLCNSCHCLIYGISLDPNLQAGIGVSIRNLKFSSALPATFNPVRHIWYADRIMDIDDGLPKFKDAPKEQFGSGELM